MIDPGDEKIIQKSATHELIKGVKPWHTHTHYILSRPGR